MRSIRSRCLSKKSPPAAILPTARCRTFEASRSSEAKNRRSHGFAGTCVAEDLVERVDVEVAADAMERGRGLLELGLGVARRGDQRERLAQHRGARERGRDLGGEPPLHELLQRAPRTRASPAGSSAATSASVAASNFGLVFATSSGASFHVASFQIHQRSRLRWTSSNAISAAYWSAAGDLVVGAVDRRAERPAAEQLVDHEVADDELVERRAGLLAQLRRAACSRPG